MHLGHSQGWITSMVFNSHSVTAAGEEFLTSPVPFLFLVSHTSLFKLVPLLQPTQLPVFSSPGTRKCTSYQPWQSFSPHKRTGMISRVQKTTSIHENSNQLPLDILDLHRTSIRFPTTASTMNTFCSMTSRLARTNSKQHVKWPLQWMEMKRRCTTGLRHVVVFSNVQLKIASIQYQPRPCPNDAEQLLELVKECPVEFVYVWQADEGDKRQWLSGIVWTGDLKSSNLHNHPPQRSNKSTVKSSARYPACFGIRSNSKDTWSHYW